MASLETLMSCFKARHMCLKVRVTRFPHALTLIPPHTYHNLEVLILIHTRRKTNVMTMAK